MKKIIINCRFDVTEEEVQHLINGQKIKLENWFDSLPLDVKNFLYRLMEIQRSNNKLI